jgi:5'(3')-deoxyribonucleotidase
MDKIKVYVDFDSSLVNSTKKLVEMLNEKFHKNEDWTKIKKYNCNDLFPEVTQQQVTDIFADELFFHGLEIFDNANEVLSAYSDMFDYIIVTIGTQSNLFWKEKWCLENLTFPFIFYGIEKDGMGKGKDVCDMSGGIIIDDHIDNIITSNADYKILYKGNYETEWNQLPVDVDAFEAKRWIQVHFLLDNILAEKGIVNE